MLRYEGKEANGRGIMIGYWWVDTLFSIRLLSIYDYHTW
jgi:hypothetical protein